MKISKWFIGLAIVAISFSGCSKDEGGSAVSPDIENASGAVATCNTSSAGVYKGILVGSSGYFKISLKNGTDTVSCKIVFDGKTAYLTTTSLNSWTPGQAISNAVFTGTLDGQAITLTLSCNADGTNVTVTITYPGHEIGVSVVKETSTTQVKCYEGTYTDGTQTGVFNLAVYGTKAYGFRKDAESSGTIIGTVSGNSLTIDEGDSPKKFTIDDNGVNGSFDNGDGVTITVTGKRSM
jgi:hypothetical protein